MFSNLNDSKLYSTTVINCFQSDVEKTCTGQIHMYMCFFALRKGHGDSAASVPQCRWGSKKDSMSEILTLRSIAMPGEYMEIFI